MLVWHFQLPDYPGMVFIIPFVSVYQCLGVSVDGLRIKGNRLADSLKVSLQLATCKVRLWDKGTVSTDNTD